MPISQTTFLRTLLVMGVVALYLVPSASSQVTCETGLAGGGYGDLFFPTSATSGTAQQHFTNGLALLHLFEYELARQEFSQARTLNGGSFAMASWGEAMTYQQWNGYESPAAGQQALNQASMSGITERETAYINAARALFSSTRARDQRLADFSAAMEALVAKYSYDIDAHAFHALGLLLQSKLTTGSAAPKYNEAIEILDAIRPQSYLHVGVLHYTVLARVVTLSALNFASSTANSLASAAPQSSNAALSVARVAVARGQWRAASEAAEKAWNLSIAQQRQKSWPVTMRNWEALRVLHYALLQRGQFARAEIIQGALTQFVGYGVSNFFPLQARHAQGLTVLEALGARQVSAVPEDTPSTPAPILPPTTNANVTTTPVPVDPAPAAPSTTAGLTPAIPYESVGTENYDAWFAHAEATRLLADGLALVSNGRPFEEVSAIMQTLDAHIATFKGPHVSRLQVSRALLFAAATPLQGGQPTEMDTRLQTAVALESSLPAILSAGPVPGKPACEFYGEHLVTTSQAPQAVTVFEACLAKFPGRSRSLLGLARARASGSSESAEEDITASFQAYLDARDGADPGVDGISEANQKIEDANAPPKSSAMMRGILVGLGVGCILLILVLVVIVLKRRMDSRDQTTIAGEFGMVSDQSVVGGDGTPLPPVSQRSVAGSSTRPYSPTRSPQLPPPRF